MISFHEWLDEYSVSHKNPTNKLIHRVCVPAIMWSLLGLLHQVMLHGELTLMWVLIVISLLFYFLLGLKVFIFMLFITGPMVASIYYFNFGWQVYLATFVIAWIGQFVGHKIEGKKPSFFQDLAFLLIGPIWIFGEGVRKLK